mmetsp:Transcript_62838/g.159081  ORF Transcript_62838/g.159081 Transcript_62838/m.159081 type:complete len:252 (+) Transcript_62838:122-877(+)
MALALEPTPRGGELEGPEEVRGLLEMRADGVDLMDQVLHTINAMTAKFIGYDGIVRDRDALLVHLGKAPLVNELADGLQSGVAISHIGLHELKHLQDGFVHLEKDAVVELPQAEELEDFARLRAHLDDALDPHDEEELRLRLHEEVATEFRLATKIDELLFVGGVLLLVLLRPLLQRLPLLLPLFLGSVDRLLLLLRQCGVASELQLNLFGHGGALGDLVGGNLVALGHLAFLQISSSGNAAQGDTRAKTA